MQTPIDFGKKFIQSFFRNRNAEEAVACLADDIIWITPDEIYHLNSKEDIRDFVKKRIARDPQQYVVDIASIRSAPGQSGTGTIVYDVNLIPKNEKEAFNLRISLTIYKAGVGYKIVFIGMSRRYERSDAEQMRGFMEDLPSGILVLASLGAGEVKLLFSNGYIRSVLGYEEDVFYARTDDNPFFMVPYIDQKRLYTLVAELSSLSKPKPLAMQVSLTTSEGEELPFQAILTAAYKDGRRTVLYLMFHDISDILTLEERKHRKEIAALEEQHQKEIEERVGQETEEVIRRQEEIRSKLEDTLKEKEEELSALRTQQEQELSAVREESDKALKTLREENEKSAQALQEAHEQKILSIEEELNSVKEDSLRQIKELTDRKEEELLSAQEEARSTIEETKRQLEETSEEKNREIAALKQEQEAQLENARADADTELAALRDKLAAVEQELSALQEKYDASLERRKESDKQYEDRILKLTWDLQHAENEARTRIEEETGKIQSAAEEQIAQARLEAEETCSEKIREMEEIRSQAEGAKQGYLTQIRRLDETIHEQQLGMDKIRRDTALQLKEKDKALDRMQHLIGGQMRSIYSSLESALDEKDVVRKAELISEAQLCAEDAPGMGNDLAAIGMMDMSQRERTADAFRLSECINTVQGVIWPQCRERGIIFSCEADGTVPDDVIGDKAGLQLAFLSILENAMQGTAGGGKIILTVTAKPPVRGKAYFHFVITDTGKGIPEERMTELFDDPQKELALAKKIVTQMGGSIQVRSNFGKGSRFEIRVNMALGKR